MAKGYGFAGEGDWKTAAFLRVLKVMAGNVGTSFMEDYTNHLEQGNELILGSHMLEVCPTIAAGKPTIVVAPLSMGDKADPARLVLKENLDGRLTQRLWMLVHAFGLSQTKSMRWRISRICPSSL